jgi:hypothetical protein
VFISFSTRRVVANALLTKQEKGAITKRDGKKLRKMNKKEPSRRRKLEEGKTARLAKKIARGWW